MAWGTSPRTWSDGDIVTEALMNAELKDKLDALEVHAHGGANGDGAQALAGVDTITLDDGSDPAAPGSSKVILYTKSGVIYYRAGASGAATALSSQGHASRHNSGGADALAADSTAGTPMLRSLSTTSTTAAPGNHTHVLTDEGSSQTDLTHLNASVGNSHSYSTDSGLDTEASTSEADFTSGTAKTPGATGVSFFVSWGYALAQDSSHSGGASTVSVRLKKDGSTVVTNTQALLGNGNINSYIRAITYTDASPSIASHTYKTTHQITTSSQVVDIVGGSVVVQEFSQT